MKNKIISLPEGFLAERDKRMARALTSPFAGVRVSARDGVADMVIYDEIGYWGITAKAFRAALDGVKEPTINLRINSPGGDVFDGVAIYNDLLQHSAQVNVMVTGVAASAASVIAMAGDVIEIAPSASMMIHRAWGAVIGNTTDMQEFAGVLAQIDDALAGVYAARAGIKPADALELMDAETWFFGQGAVDAGFADRVTELPEASTMMRGDRLKGSLREPAQPVAQQDDARLVAALRGLQQTITR